jgi:hypothetical protein
LRKAQKEKLKAAQGSIDSAFEKLEASGGEPREKENSAPAKSQANVANGGEADPEGLKAEECTQHIDVKVQWDQLLHVEGDDGEMMEEFICKICQVHVVGCEPKLARCSHIFCGDCIAKWFETQPKSQSWAQRAQSAGLVPCPVCKEPLHEERDLFTVCPNGQNESALLWRLLSGVKIICRNNPKCCADGNCTWSGDYGSYQKHLQSCKNVALDGASPAVRREGKIKSAAPVLQESSEDGSHALSEAAQTSEGTGLADLIQELVVHEATQHEGAVSAKLEEAQLLPEPVVQQQPELVQTPSALRAVKAFTANGPSQLDVQLGDLIEVVNQHSSGWTYGRKVMPVTAGNGQVESAVESAGWFPNWAIA